MGIEIPEPLATAQTRSNGAAGRAFLAALPGLAADLLDRWDLRTDGPPMSGMTALVLPVRRGDGSGTTAVPGDGDGSGSDAVPGDDGGSAAVLKLPFRDAETEGEPLALRAWDGDGAVRLLEHDPATGALLLERLTPVHHPDPHTAVLVVARLLARLTAVPAPAGLRRLADIAGDLTDRTPWALTRVPDPDTRRLLADCAAAVREVLPEPGDRLLHWDLHYENVLRAERSPSLAIDPKPLAGDPGFDLYPALANRFDPADLPWRFDALTDVLGLDRNRARAWTLARVLQNALWAVEDGDEMEEEVIEIGRRVRAWR
ncbi:aminoglycoside phosphotransferase family protein [Streptomyces sp. NPDC048290]|uniref:aminoglycoside phosphotransferase family protein n=1 Tax=Streptomyces sp. NPDC048290 TaxID=3155811 RepID=UPI00342FD22B